jgi:pyridoxal phosphate phosphatase PHOSPHO2
MKRIQASVSAEGEKQFIYVGDGKNDFCPALTLKETDALMPRKNFPLWELICNNKMLVEANIQEWSDWVELETKLHNLTNTIFIEEKCSVRADQLVPS